MSTPRQQPVVALCCAVFEAEAEALRQGHWPDLVIRYQSSMLHMKPEKLAVRLDKLTTEELRLGNKVLLIYGDCCMGMAALAERPSVARTRGNNCCDLLLGSGEYRRLAHTGAFFLFPEWARRWQHIFSIELGLNQVNATSLMGDMHKKLVYLDTGVVPVPMTELEECANYCGLPWESLQVSLEPLRAAIQDALDKLKATDPPE
ncbi:MAG: DUF1638 domain-containing protein [Desulfobulbaceae bacterium]|nr:DUF1638 domain-containing protein [Desulfobulbaceae bacterium]